MAARSPSALLTHRPRSGRYNGKSRRRKRLWRGDGEKLVHPAKPDTIVCTGPFSSKKGALTAGSFRFTFSKQKQHPHNGQRTKNILIHQRSGGEQRCPIRNKICELHPGGQRRQSLWMHNHHDHGTVGHWGHIRGNHPKPGASGGDVHRFASRHCSANALEQLSRCAFL